MNGLKDRDLGKENFRKWNSRVFEVHVLKILILVPQIAIDERELRGGNRELKLEENVLFENVTKMTWIVFMDRFQTVYNCFHRRMPLRPLSRNRLFCPVT